MCTAKAAQPYIGSPNHIQGKGPRRYSNKDKILLKFLYVFLKVFKFDLESLSTRPHQPN